ncbi:MAG TPA: hypothetical protein DCR43_02280 [Bacteroidales bacterium]|nr:MAG: hypothetical protein A2X11_07610 [Bacteroidetes bacterium GWE2_42_24]OFY29477.1 MAG: hypothetical protein A2X09_03990 [Bacteroidetes bacterium GWF2_43_11]HAQ64676.1 hypothetical protein [Bacteroidales bacterium]HBZ67271.1 hypothetical protein [Bacteroidales bacterium]
MKTINYFISLLLTLVNLIVVIKPLIKKSMEPDTYLYMVSIILPLSIVSLVVLFVVNMKKNENKDKEIENVIIHIFESNELLLNSYLSKFNQRREHINKEWGFVKKIDALKSKFDNDREAAERERRENPPVSL